MKKLSLIACCIMLFRLAQAQQPAVVMQTDFGLKDGAVSAMKGVSTAVSPGLRIYDLTHEIPPYNIWEASYRLYQTLAYWPRGTVFVSVVDPGVGTQRKSVVMRTRSGHYVVTPDNGTLTLVADAFGIDEVREIDEAVNRRQASGASYTFHGRDVYAYTAARLAAGIISFETVGRKLPDSVVRLPYQTGVWKNNKLLGTIPILDVQYGNVWTNIGEDLVRQSGIAYGDQLRVTILHDGKTVFSGMLPFCRTFGEVKEGMPLVYLNSLMQLSLALNMKSFADQYKIKSGNTWLIQVEHKSK